MYTMYGFEKIFISLKKHSKFKLVKNYKKLVDETICLSQTILTVVEKIFLIMIKIVSILIRHFILFNESFFIKNV